MAVTDDFTGTEDASLDSAKWLILMGTFVYKSNQTFPSTGANNVAKWIADSFNNDQDSKVDCPVGGFFGPCVRLTGTGAGDACGYVSLLHFNDSRIYRLDNGAFTAITDGPNGGVGAPTTATTGYLSIVGSTITLRENGPAGTIIGTATDATYASGVPGIYGNDQTATTRMDNFEANGEIGGGDVTPPTISSWATNVAGTEITGTLSESGCTPASGTGGFTLSGTSATVASWAISGTTITLTLSGTIANGETVLLSYDDATASEAIADAATNLLADITNAAVTNNVPSGFTAGTASFVSSGPAGISVSATDATGGSESYTYQWERNEDGGAFSDLVGETALACTDDTANTEGVLYGYRVKYDDGVDTVTSNTVTAEVYDGGPLAGGGGSNLFQTHIIRGA